MPFGTITVNGSTFEPRQPGIYSLAGVTFDAPSNEIRLRGATISKNGGSATVTRYAAKDVVVGDDTIRKNCAVSLQIQVPSGTGFTAAEIDAMALDISEFLTTENVSRLLQGES